MTAIILGPHLDTHGVFSLFFAAILISLMNFMLEKMVIEPLIGRGV